MIKKLKIRNYRRFQEFDLDLGAGLNVLVGNNDTGKSTVMEAISLALTGRLHGRSLYESLSPYLFNQSTAEEYTNALQAGATPTPPSLIVEVYFERSTETASLAGSNNLAGEDECGVRIQVVFNDEYCDEYEQFIKDPQQVRMVPTEYYKVEWIAFSGSSVTRRSLPAAAAVIDPSSLRLSSGVDFHLQNIISNQLSTNDRVELSRQYRSLRQEFGDKGSVQQINESLRKGNGEISHRELSLDIDISQRYTWESSLVAHLDQLPFQFIGKGDQNTVKTLLAVGRHAEDKQIVMIEEPENHLSFSRLRDLLHRVLKLCEGKQVIVATHSAFVLNKLGIDHTILLGKSAAPARISDLAEDTVSFFKRLPGHDTLRLVLSDGAILVEGASDELVVQRAYRDANGIEPLDEGIDVISVGSANKRFMELASAIGRRTWCVRDNDEMTPEELAALYEGYVDGAVVTLHSPTEIDQSTLEIALAKNNTLDTLNAVLSRDFASLDAAQAWMLSSKTDAALRIYESGSSITMPEYILDVCRK